MKTPEGIAKTTNPNANHDANSPTTSCPSFRCSSTIGSTANAIPYAVDNTSIVP